MNKIIVITLIIATSLVIGAGIMISLPKNGNQQDIPSTQRIAILAPAAHPAIEEIESGFKETMSKQGMQQYSFKSYNANGNKTLLRAQAEEIVLGNYDLIFTIGASCTQTIKELTTKKQRLTPVVFTAVDNPVAMGVIASLSSPGNHITGVIDKPSYTQQLDALFVVKPKIAQALIVYDPTHGTGREQELAEIKALFAARGATIKRIEIYQSHEIREKVAPFIVNADLVMVPNGDNTVVSGIDSLVTLCNRNGVTLFASDLNSGDKGAALAYGVREHDFGTQAAQQAMLILDHKQHPTTIPVALVSNQHLKINSKTAQPQGVAIDLEAIKNKLPNVEVI